MLIRMITAGLGTLAAASLMVSAAQAAPISGSVDVSAGFTLIGGTDFTNSTGLDTTNDDGIITNSSGDIAGAGFGFGDTGTHLDVCYAAGCAPAVPVANLFSFTEGLNTLAFDLSTIAVESVDANSIELSGTGTLKLTGFDDTFGQWRLTAQTAGGSTFSFSSTAVTDVPEPATLGLLGVGLLGIGLATRRRRV